MTKPTNSTLSRHYEIHACKAGITNEDLDGKHVYSGSIKKFDFVLHVFRDGAESIQAILVENFKGQNHWFFDEEPDARIGALFPSHSKVRSSRNFQDLVKIALYPELLPYLFNGDWIVERVGEHHCGKVNIADLEENLLNNMESGPSLAVFSRYANCEINLKADTPPVLSDFDPNYIEQAESARLYLGPPW